MSASAASHTTGLGRWHRHGWIAVLGVGAVLFVAVERTGVATRNPNLIPSAILLGAAVVPAAFLTFVSGRRLPYRVPAAAVGLTSLLGGVIGTVVAATLEFDVLRRLGTLPMAGVGLIEETSKLLVPLAVCYLWGYRGRADGLLLGVACGAGFAALETMGYALVTLIRTRGDITDTVDLLLLRGFLSPAAHMAWTGIAAAALFGAAQVGWRHRSAGRFVLAFLAAVVLHTLWDSLGSLIGYLVIGVVSLSLLWYAAHTSTTASDTASDTGPDSASGAGPAPGHRRVTPPTGDPR